MVGLDLPADPTPAAAMALQRQLRELVRQEPLDLATVRLIAGADLSAEGQRGSLYAGVVVMDRVSGETVAEVVGRYEATFPYVPGLLSFRELPPLRRVWERLPVTPDALLCDGQGLAHPRRCGLACHAGLVFDRPTIGCAKSRLLGEFVEPGLERGATAPLTDGGETIGAVLRTRAGVQPVFVSVGHRCRLADAIALVLACCPRYRLPEPLQRAHRLVNEARRGERPCVSN